MLYALERGMDARTHAGDIGHVFHGTGKRAEHADDKSNSREDHSAGAMLSNSVHHDAEGQDVAAHDEDGEEELANAEELPSECTEQDITSVGQILDVGIALMELSNNIACVGSKETQSNNQDKSARMNR